MSLQKDFVQFTATADGATSGQVGSRKRAVSKIGVDIIRTAGVTDVIDVDLQLLGNDQSTWIKFADIVTSVAGGSVNASNIDEPVGIWRVLVVTVGAGNTLSIAARSMD